MSQHHKRLWTGADSTRARNRIKAGPPIQRCIRCGGAITIADTRSWDAGHLVDLAQGGSTHRYGPEHRGCNRRAGGKAGARKTNAQRRNGTPPDDRLPNW